MIIDHPNEVEAEIEDDHVPGPIVVRQNTRVVIVHVLVPTVDDTVNALVHGKFILPGEFNF